MKASSIRRTTVMAACAGLAISWGCAGSAEAAASSGFQTGGKSVSLQTDSAKAPTLSAGMYQAKLPAESQTWHMKVSRQPGERLEIGVVGYMTWKNGLRQLPADSSEDTTVALSTTDGAGCQSEHVPVSGGEVSGMMPFIRLFIDPKSDERVKSMTQDSETCRTATNFDLTIQRSISGSNAEPMPTQMSVVTVPKTKDAPKNPSSDNIAPISTSPLPAKEKINPGNGFLDAPAVKPQGYTVNVTPGQIQFVKVHLSPGQRLSAGWEFPASGSGASVTQDLKMKAIITNPNLNNAMLYDGSDSATIRPSTSEAQGVHMYTPAVDYANANLSVQNGEENAQFVTDPGWYYVGVRMSLANAKDKGGLKSTKPIPTTLSLRVQGDAKEGPAMDVAQPKPGHISGPPSGSRVSTALWAGLGALGLLGVLASGVVMRRRARR